MKEFQNEDEVVAIREILKEFKDLKKRMNNFFSTIEWAIVERGACEEDICNEIRNCQNLITMRYSKKNIPEFYNGDIIEVNCGGNLKGEISGVHTHCIVCNALDEIIYIVPVIKAKDGILFSQDWLPMEVTRDAIYFEKDYDGGTVLVDKGCYLNKKRVVKRIGTTTSEFYKKVVFKLKDCNDFTKQVEYDLPFFWD